MTILTVKGTYLFAPGGGDIRRGSAGDVQGTRSAAWRGGPSYSVQDKNEECSTNTNCTKGGGGSRPLEHAQCGTILEQTNKLTTFPYELGLLSLTNVSVTPQSLCTPNWWFYVGFTTWDHTDSYRDYKRQGLDLYSCSTTLKTAEGRNLWIKLGSYSKTIHTSVSLVFRVARFPFCLIKALWCF